METLENYNSSLTFNTNYMSCDYLTLFPRYNVLLCERCLYYSCI